ncbi:MAG: guanylate kinase [Dehalococcoidia bacterium]|nr:guanylate kinase [Dehalococcoidia bacterium]
MTDLNPQPLILILSGPSGAGKDFVLGGLKAQPIAGTLAFIVTNTTRPKRADEAQDVNYHFVSQAEFQRMIAASELLEYANVYGNWYGVPKAPIRAALTMGHNAIIKVDVQGARTIRQVLPQAVLVFLSPPSLSQLDERLRRRNTELPADLACRLKTAETEMTERSDFDYVIINENDRADLAVAELEAIITAERLRASAREYLL